MQNIHRDLIHVHPRRKREAMMREREQAMLDFAKAEARKRAAQRAAATRRANKLRAAITRDSNGDIADPSELK